MTTDAGEQSGFSIPYPWEGTRTALRAVRPYIDPVMRATNPVTQVASRLRGGDADVLAQIEELLASGQPVPVELLRALQAEDPDTYNAVFFYPDTNEPIPPEQVGQSTGWGDILPEPEPEPTAPLGTMSQTLKSMLDAMLEEYQNTPANERGLLVEDMAKTMRLYTDSLDMESGMVKMPDGMMITSEMLNASDPALRAQYEQIFEERQRALENESIDLFNRYQLDQYALDRGAVQDENARRTAAHSAALASVRTRLENFEIDLKQAAQEVERIINGQQESRARADFEAATQLAAAPWATGGKTAFSPADVGMGRLAQLGGIRDTSAPVIRYPGTTNIDPRGAIQYWDQQGNVAGGTQATPINPVSDADIPRGVSLSATPSVPRLTMPSTGNVIVRPGDPRYTPYLDAGFGPANHPQSVPALRLP